MYFGSNKILVVGDIMHDQYWQGDCNRISPEAPVPIVNINGFIDKAGGAANVAINISTLNTEVTLLGIVGKDESATTLTNLLQNKQVVCKFLTDANKPTIKKLRIVEGHNSQMIRLDFESAFNGHEQLKETFVKCLDEIDVVVFSDYNKGTLQDIAQLIKLAKDNNKKVIIDPKNSNFGVYAGADLITPNLKELRQAIGAWNNQAEMEQKTKALLQQHNIAAILITLSEKGMALVTDKPEVQYFKSKAIEVADVTGAGDTVVAVTACAWGLDNDLPQAIKIANVAAGIVVSKHGSATASIEEIAYGLHDWETKKVIQPENLANLVAKLRKKKHTIVLTNGCFDLLHLGHVKYLRDAKELGDKLIVAINVDATITASKGANRPINQLKDRMAMLASMEMVDFVVPFAENTPHNVIEQIKPDFLVKGGDYKSIKDVVGAEEVLKYGGQVKVLSFIENRSTSATIDKIIKHNNTN